MPTLEEPQAFFWATADNFVAVDAPDAKAAQLLRYAICNQEGKFSTVFQQGEQAYLCCEFLLKESIEVPIVSLMITNKFNVVVYTKAWLRWKPCRELKEQADFDLAPWIEQARVWWIAPGDTLLTLQNQVKTCPYLDLPGRQEVLFASRGNTWMANQKLWEVSAD